MKKVLLFLSLLFASFLFFGDAGAVSVDVTEEIPGVCEGTPDSDGVITCEVGRGFDVVSTMFGSIIRYFTFIAALAAVLYIVINGILYSMAGINDGLKGAAKDRIVKTLLGLILLLLSGVILNAIAPWIYK